jgi:hypothetical protein
MNKLLSSRQAAEYLGIKEGTLRLWRSNMITYPLSCSTPVIKYRKIGKKIIYSSADLDAHIEKSTRR